MAVVPRTAPCIVAANDLMAIGVMKACEEAALRIPEDIAIVGMDNLDISSRVHPKLTSVSLNQQEIGRRSAQVLMDRLLGKLRDEAENNCCRGWWTEFQHSAGMTGSGP